MARQLVVMPVGWPQELEKDVTLEPGFYLGTIDGKLYLVTKRKATLYNSGGETISDPSDVSKIGMLQPVKIEWKDG